MQTGERLMFKQVVMLVRPIGDTKAINARVTSHQEIVRGVTNHDC